MARAMALRADARALPLPDASVDLIVTSPPYWALRSYTDGGKLMSGQIGSEPTPAEYLANLLACTAEWMRVLKPEGSMFINLGDKFSLPGKGERSGHGLGSSSIVYKIGAAQPNRSARDFGYGGVPAKSLLGLPWRYANRCVDELGLILRRDIVWHKSNGLPESASDRCRSSHEYLFHLVKSPCYYSAVDEIREPAGDYQGKTWADRKNLPGANPGGHAFGLSAGTANGATVFAANPLGKLPGSVWEVPADEPLTRVILRAVAAGALAVEEAERLLAPPEIPGDGIPGIWTIPTEPLSLPAYLGVDHYAAFPTALPRKCILGWSPPGICTACGQGRFPVAEKAADGRQRADSGDGGRGLRGLPGYGDVDRSSWAEGVQRQITGYACACTPYTDYPERRGPSATPGRMLGRGRQQQDARAELTGSRHHGDDWPERQPVREYHFDRWTPPPARPARVFDPFGGTGTTALVAVAHGRDGITADLGADYSRAAQYRLRDGGERAKARGQAKPAPVKRLREDLYGGLTDEWDELLEESS